MHYFLCRSSWFFPAPPGGTVAKEQTGDLKELEVVEFEIPVAFDMPSYGIFDEIGSVGELRTRASQWIQFRHDPFGISKDTTLLKSKIVNYLKYPLYVNCFY